MPFEFEAELWEYQGEAPWVFVTLPTELASEIKAGIQVGKPFGSVRVKVTTGSSTWTTSLFPDGDVGTYVLPVKRDVRRSEALDIGDHASFRLTLEG